MLSLTENATTAICALAERTNLPQGSGLRIATTDASDGTAQLALSTALEPQEGDQVVEQEGARVFLEPVAADALDGKVLDAQIDDDGRVQFLVAAQ